MADAGHDLAHEDSIDSQDPKNQKSKKAKNRKPANTAFRQQRLKAWQPILTPKSVLPLFFAIGIVFAPIGGVLLWASSQVQEIIIDYTQCSSTATSQISPMPSGAVTWHFRASNGSQPQALWQKETVPHTYSDGITINTTQCTLIFDIPATMSHPVLFYYKLTNFYQNHRRYVKSFQQDQLKGIAVSAATISSSTCDPLRLDPSGKPYYPCGLIANSVFNDTFSNPILTPSTTPDPASDREYFMNNNSGIAWDSDAALYGKTQYDASQVAVPPNWVERYPGGYTNATLPDLSTNQAFQVWMRTAGLPTFSKLAQRNDTADLESGRYTVRINSNFAVDKYGGTKSIIISTRTVVGGRNIFLGVAYVVVGGICVVLGVVFTLTHLFRPRKLGDHTYLSWNNDRGTSATTTGREVRPGEGAL